MRVTPSSTAAVLFLVLLARGWSFGPVWDSSAAAQHRALEPEYAAALAEPPQKARDLLATLQDRQGVPLPGYRGGQSFRNRERRLPRGRYREYDVNPRLRGRPRDAERIVIEQRTGKAYYTPDHYHTFVPLN